MMMSDNQFESGTYFDDGEYLDKSKDKVFRVKPGVNYSVKVKVGLYNSENVRVFIDYNNDGKFQSYLGEVSTQVSATTSIQRAVAPAVTVRPRILVWSMRKPLPISRWIKQHFVRAIQ